MDVWSNLFLSSGAFLYNVASPQGWNALKVKTKKGWPKKVIENCQNLDDGKDYRGLKVWSWTCSLRLMGHYSRFQLARKNKKDTLNHSLCALSLSRSHKHTHSTHIHTHSLTHKHNTHIYTHTQHIHTSNFSLTKSRESRRGKGSDWQWPTAF